MATVVTIDDRELRSFLKNMGKLPDKLDTFMFNVTKKVATAIKMNASRKRLHDTGNLKDSIEARRLSNNQTVVYIPKYGLYLDADLMGYKKSHYHWNSPQFQLWLKKRKGQFRKRASGYKGAASAGDGRGGMLVRSHPFIRAPLEREMSKIGPELKSLVNRWVK